MRLHTHRKRHHHHWFDRDLAAIHGHPMEYVIESIYVLCAAAQLAACPGYYSTASVEYYTVACYVFVVTSLIVVVLTLHTMWEVHAAHKASKKASFAGTIAGMTTSSREYLESLCFVVASMMFAVGCCLYIPDVGGGRLKALRNATTMFCVGSAANCFAAFINSLSLVKPCGFEDNGTFQLAAAALGLSELGAATLFAGSFFFYPEVSDGTCNVGPSWASVDVGTNLFIAGCSLYLTAAILNIISMHKKARMEVGSFLSEASSHQSNLIGDSERFQGMDERNWPALKAPMAP